MNLMQPLKRMMSSSRRVQLALVGVLTTLGLIGIWYLVTAGLGLIAPLSLTDPVTLFKRIIGLSSTPYLGETIWGHTWSSLQVALMGWILGGAIGLPLGVMMSWVPVFRKLVFPTFQALRSISPIAWIPLAIVWFGIETSARVFIVFIAAVIPWVINSMEAVESVDKQLIKAARNLGAKRRVLHSVVLPAGAPTLLAGARIALGNAWTALIAGELLAATSGLGYMALNSSRALDTPTILAAMAFIGLLGMIFSAVLTRLQSILAPWAV